MSLLTDSENIVRRSLVENGLARLCVFFGRQKANDVVLSHLITFLNDKNDWQLRAAFYSGIAGGLVRIIFTICCQFYVSFGFCRSISDTKPIKAFEWHIS